MAFRDLRHALAAYRDRGRLLEVDEEISPVHEASAVLSEAGRRGSGAVRFSRLKGSSAQAVGNVIYGREALAWALDAAEEDVPAELGRRLAHPLPHRLAEEAPVLEQRAADDLPLTGILPVFTHYAGDSAPFLTTGVVSARDPDTGAVARGIHRMEVRGARELGMALLNPPLAALYARHKDRGEPMPVAVTIGLEPLTFAAFALKGAPGADKLALAGGLRGEAVEVAPGPATGIEVPARAEFLLEGKLDPADEREDGPLGEIGGYSLTFPSTPTFRVERLAHRTDPVYHALLPTGPEGDLLLGIVAEASTAPRTRELFPFAQALHFVPSTFGSSLVVRVADAPTEQVRSLLVHLLALPMVKKVVAVAEDVDPANPAEVEWSVITRSQPDRDVIVLGGLRGQPIDPSCPRPFLTAKLAVDATGYERLRGRKRAEIPPHALATARALLSGRRPHG